MNRIVVVLLGVVFVAVAAFAYGGRTNLFKSGSSADTPVQAPDHITYGHVLPYVAALRERADETERRGDDARHLREFFKVKANLNDSEAATLDQIASQCVLEIKQR